MVTETTKYNSRKKKVLIVDDEPDVNRVLKMVLDQSGFNADSYDDPILSFAARKVDSVRGSGYSLLSNFPVLVLLSPLVGIN